MRIYEYYPVKRMCFRNVKDDLNCNASCNARALKVELCEEKRKRSRASIMTERSHLQCVNLALSLVIFSLTHTH